ncbi:MAG: hypothetical protein GXX80_00115 [Thermotogaceae bacterium]|nr:hypothetical protein [Thermotogaceae bacterium]
MNFRLVSSDYSKLIDLFGRVSGTVEPSYRYFQIYYRRGLKFFATDGCLKLEFSSSIPVDPFTGVHSVPIDYARALKSSDEKSFVSFSSEGETIEIKTDSETLSLQKARDDALPAMERKFEFSSRFPLKEFNESLNFVSAASMEGDTVEIFSKGSETILAASAGRLVLLSILEYEPRTDFHFSLQYVTVRHLVKTLELLKTQVLDAGSGISELGLKAGTLLFSICTDETEFPKPPSFLFGETASGVGVQKKAFLSALRKITRLSRRGFSVLMISDGKKLKLFLKAGSLRYECEISAFSGEEFVIQLDPRKLQSALSRINDSLILLLMKKGNLLMVGKKSKMYLLIPLIN